MIKKIFHIQSDALGVEIVCVLHLLAIYHSRLCVVFYIEFQHILIVDGIDDGISVERFSMIALFVQLSAKHICSSHHFSLFTTGINSKNWGAGKAKHDVLLETLLNLFLHGAKLRAVALVKDENENLIKNLLLYQLFPQEARHLLYRGDDDVRIIATGIELIEQYFTVHIAIGTVRAETVVFLHRLIVQILSVNDEYYLMYSFYISCKLSRLERGQGFPRTGSVPDVASCLSRTFPMMIQGNLDTLGNTLGSSYLVRTHHQQFLIYIEHTIFGKNFEQRAFYEEGLGKVLQVADKVVFPITPVACKLKRVALNFLFLPLLLVSFLLTSIAGGIAVILGLSAIADDKQLNVIKHSLACPEAFASIAVYLVEGFPDAYTSAFQLNMNEWQTVHQDGYIIAVGVGSASGHVLVDNLQIILEHVIFMDKVNIGINTIVTFYFYCGIFLLNHAGLILHRERFAG